ncbi:hypothetical protein Trydic_g11269 [Trypoxylus dichotomus]
MWNDRQLSSLVAAFRMLAVRKRVIEHLETKELLTVGPNSDGYIHRNQLIATQPLSSTRMHKISLGSRVPAYAKEFALLLDYFPLT